MTTVVITGFMGTGKTSVGKALAARLNAPFLDTDALVEEDEGRTVSAIFASDGEEYFRRAEKRAIATSLAVSDAVIATGGGAVLDADNVQRMKDTGKLICLTAEPAVIEQRVRAQGETRPLLADAQSRQRIQTLLQERAEAYAQADIQIDTSTSGIDEVIEEIVTFLETTNR